MPRQQWRAESLLSHIAPARCSMGAERSWCLRHCHLFTCGPSDAVGGIGCGTDLLASPACPEDYLSEAPPSTLPEADWKSECVGLVDPADGQESVSLLPSAGGVGRPDSVRSPRWSSATNRRNSHVLIFSAEHSTTRQDSQASISAGASPMRCLATHRRIVSITLIVPRLSGSDVGIPSVGRLVARQPECWVRLASVVAISSAGQPSRECSECGVYLSEGAADLMCVRTTHGLRATAGLSQFGQSMVMLPCVGSGVSTPNGPAR